MTMAREEQIRKKAKELGQQYFPDSSNIWARSNVEACYVENACVEMAEWVDQHPQWIPVEERLPEEGQVVFIYTKHGSVSSVTYKDGAFNLNEVLEAINVTHWMPIVPPRKEE